MTVAELVYLAGVASIGLVLVYGLVRLLDKIFWRWLDRR